MNDNKTLMPEYMREFKCIGAGCEDTCCAFWNVDIDQETYNRYQKVNHPTLAERLKTSVIVKKANVRTKKTYAAMKLNPSTGACCFHDNGLCSIQAELGESYLSPTCATYPRNVNEVNGQQEVSAVLSCPEAARLAILNPKGIEFAYNEPLSFPNMQWNARVVTEARAAMPVVKYFWDLRVIAIEILQNRNFSLPHRFMLLAVLADRIDELCGKGVNDKTPEELEQFRAELTQDEGVADRNLFPTNHHFQVRFLNDLLLTVVEKHLWHNLRYKECLDQYLQGMQQAGENTDQIIAYFEEALQQILFTVYGRTRVHAGKLFG